MIAATSSARTRRGACSLIDRMPRTLALLTQGFVPVGSASAQHPVRCAVIEHGKSAPIYLLGWMHGACRIVRMLHMKPVGDYLALDADECRALGLSLAEQYRNAKPFPHIVIDDFLDTDVLRRVLENFPSSDNKP